MIRRRQQVKRDGTVLAVLIGLVTSCVSFQCIAPALATRLPGDMAKAATSTVEAKVRLDGALQTSDGQLFLLLVPAGKEQKKGKVEVEDEIAHDKKIDVLLYSNGWAHVRVVKRGDATTLALHDLPDKIRKHILSLHFPSDMIVPQGFVLPKSYKALITEVPSVSLVDDAVLSSADFGQKPKAAKMGYKGDGSLFLTSITSGSITMLDGKNLKKIAEFPTEGTPCSMELSNGQLYIADQAKNRILMLDPAKRRFLGQIDLPPHAAPKGLAIPPSGQWVYVSESGAGDIAVVDTASGKVLVKTKVHPGPGKLAITPDGNTLLVLNVTTGEVTFISTYNQRVISTIRVGDMPGSLVISHDGKFAYIANRISNTVSILDLGVRRVVGTIKCGQAPTAVLLSKDDKKLYVSTGRDDMVTEYDCASLAKLRELRVPVEVEFPGSLCMLPDGHHFVALSEGGDSMVVIDSDKWAVQNQVALGHANHDAVWEPVP